ncbi:hypothetical protein CTAYLR_000835 [Chrysophaeum taylorii]|uniref:GPI-anchor transamidase n=1 Tax=Chrysophaeum taylorii TaxID=2483200 RepID=A0AAD7URT0_9STRA|nr:hypothetical protein CTAYLR_000835 [Chrysophaeum taylorii]
MGVPADHIVTLLAEPCGCSARNAFKGSIFLEAGNYSTNLLEGVRIDSAYGRVTPRLVKDVLTGRSPLLGSGPASNVVLYMTGHGGDEFLKFQDSEELSAVELANAVREMRLKRRFRKLLVLVDTCQAGSLFSRLDDAPGVLGLASSRLGENAYASPPDATIGVALADRFTEYLAARFFRETPPATATLGDFAAALARAPTRSTLDIYDASWGSPQEDAWQATLLSAFFSSPASIPRLTDWPLSSYESGAR